MNGCAKAVRARLMISMVEPKINSLSRFGFSFERGGAHSSRTIMLDELGKLLSHVRSSEASKADYLHAITEENCLGKRSGKTRMLTYRHLVDLYSLDPSRTLFRSLLFFWNRDVEGQPLLALLCAYARDSVLRSAAPFVLCFQEGATVFRESLEEQIDNQAPGRFSKATLKSTAQNINSTLTKSGYLSGKVRKIRSHATPTPGAVAYALFLGYLTGIRGEALLKSEFANLLDCTFEKAIELAEDASRRGWIIFKRVGDVIEVLFPNLINKDEMEWIREQS